MGPPGEVGILYRTQQMKRARRADRQCFAASHAHENITPPAQSLLSLLPS